MDNDQEMPAEDQEPEEDPQTPFREALVGRRLYTRRNGRHYADFRDYGEVGGGQEALKPPGATRATTDRGEALRLAEARFYDLEALRREKRGGGIPSQLKPAAEAFLRDLEGSNEVTPDWKTQMRVHLEAAVHHFGAAKPLYSISKYGVVRWCDHLAANGYERGPLGPTSVKQYQGTLSKLFKFVAAHRPTPVTENPAVELPRKPKGFQKKESRRKLEFLEVQEVALLLFAARETRSLPSTRLYPYLYEFLATVFLSGLRLSEAGGLRVCDVALRSDFDFHGPHINVEVTPNRRVKNDSSIRRVPLWPQLEEVLSPLIKERLVFGLDAPLFPRSADEPHLPVGDVTKSIDNVALLCGYPKDTIRSLLARHTYCTVRLQTVDNEAPIAQSTVSKEMGHGSEAMVKRIYGHVPHDRPRLKYVEYRLETLRNDLRISPYLPLLESYGQLGSDTGASIAQIVEDTGDLLKLSKKAVATRVLRVHEASLYNWQSGAVIPLKGTLLRLAQLDAVVSHVETDEMLHRWFEKEPAENEPAPRDLLLSGRIDETYGRLFDARPLGSKRPAETEAEEE